uniref:zinc-dependent alcohol dehydrogenase n=1 Tax=Pararhizobium sp. IMCC3301 TaxID=3067904 RepID=UPI00274046C6|nr:zinc-binding dehydrogenase [Pararhizobium sp. IMCC3301]
MKAVRLYDPLDLRCETVAMAPDPGPDEVRVRVAYAGICGSDIHNFKTGQWITRRPSIAGHEFSGWVDAIGKNISKFSIGDKIVVDSRFYCGKCVNCCSGKTHLCENLGFVGEAIDGGFAEFSTLPAKLLLKCAADARLDIVALAEPLAVALHALKRLALPDDEPLLIIGCGPIGALAAIAANCLSPRPLLICDVNAARVSHTAKLSGATPVDLSSLRQFDNPAGQPLRYVLDTTGNVGVISSLIQSLTGCSIGLVGIGSGDLTFDPVMLVEREITVLGCHAFFDELRQAVDLLQSKPEKFEAVIGQKITLDQTLQSYQSIASGQSAAIKTLIEINHV